MKPEQITTESVKVKFQEACRHLHEIRKHAHDIRQTFLEERVEYYSRLHNKSSKEIITRIKMRK